MSKIKLMTPIVALADNTQGAKAIKINSLSKKIRLGLLDNTKPNADRLLGKVGQLLREKDTVGKINAFDKHDRPKNPASSPAGDEALLRLSTDCDFVLTALGN